MTSENEWLPTACILCFNNCGLKVQVDHGHIRRVRGDKSNPLSKGDGVVRLQGAMINELTDAGHRCPIAGTPYHKYVPVRIEAVL